MDIGGRLVRLRGSRPGDAEALAGISAHPEVARFAGSFMLLPESAEDVRAQLARRSPDGIGWVVEAQDDGAVIGRASLRRIDFRNRNCWLGIALGPPERWNRGYGQEATRLVTRFGFRQLGMEKVYLGVFEGNDRGLAAYRRAGYEVEATLERQKLLEGRLVRAHWMAAYRDHPLYASE